MPENGMSYWCDTCGMFVEHDHDKSNKCTVYPIPNKLIERIAREAKRNSIYPFGRLWVDA